ncbi:MAG TPA: hypothetical protein VL361_12215 [Candidatus Limnocylindrales bacterium]|nr:hypothetical protein [Candidatus Limnocylindrales bacterium]
MQKISSKGTAALAVGCAVLAVTTVPIPIFPVEQRGHGNINQGAERIFDFVERLAFPAGLSTESIKTLIKQTAHGCVAAREKAKTEWPTDNQKIRKSVLRHEKETV